MNNVLNQSLVFETEPVNALNSRTNQKGALGIASGPQQASSHALLLDINTVKKTAKPKPKRKPKFSSLQSARVQAAKRAFVTRNMDLSAAKYLKRGRLKPKAGDLVLARVIYLGQHKRIEKPDGRRAFLHVGDEIILSYGARYAADQFEGYVPADLSDCFMVAAGGIAATYESKNARVKKPTRIKPIGILCDANRKIINLKRSAIKPDVISESQAEPHIIAVVGSGMNAGKTTVAANIIHSLSKENLKVAALKITGTGAGGDMWQYQDAGAHVAYDFTDAGYPSTFKTSRGEIRALMKLLLTAAKAKNPDVIIIEIADGLLQEETNYIIGEDWFKSAIDSLVYAASDGLSACAGVNLLRAHNLPLIAIGGKMTSAPLCAREASEVTGVPILDAASFSNTVQLAHDLLRCP